MQEIFDIFDRQINVPMARAKDNQSLKCDQVVTFKTELMSRDMTKPTM